MRSRIVLGAGVFLAIVVAGFLTFAASRFYTEYSWYRSLGQENVFTVRIVSKTTLWAAASVFAFLVLYINTRIAERLVGASRFTSRVVRAFTAGLAALAGLSLAGNWMTFRLAVVQSPFGVPDPQFGKDVGFFVFTLPALELLATWANGLVVLSIICVLGIVLLPARPGVTAGLAGRWWRLKTVLSVLVGFLMLWSGFNYWISIWRLDIASHSQFTGASYTDVHTQIPALTILAITSVVVAIILFSTARSHKWGLLAASFGVWALISVTLGTVWPAVVQTYSVAPNEATRELPYIERNIKMTRAAFDLEDAETMQYSVAETLTPQAAARAVVPLSDARLWTPGSVEQAYSQLQTIRPYYRLSSIDTDRYSIDGRPQQVLVSAREMDTNLLPERARTWVNQHLVYTHGYGMVISSANGASEGGLPQFLVGDVPPVVKTESPGGAEELQTNQPRVYFGPDTTDYVIVNAGIDEFDYPLGEQNVTCRYEADSGVSLGGLASRLAWALRLGSNELLFSEYVRPDSRVLLHRDIRSRVNKLAPWLSFDEEPYPALVDGRITWILDAYTTSDHYPYSQPLSDGTNYIRDSVKITVDALTGDTTFYAFGDDPIRDAWAKIFPSIITPSSEISPALAKHLRYPERLISAQASVYRTYHMTDPNVFYNKEDQWQIPGETGKSPVRPSYLMLDIPGTSGSMLYLMQAYAPANRDNMISLMAGSCGPDDYGKQTVLLLPKERVILGSQQVEARIEQDPEISPQLSLWDQRGSNVLLGEMLVLPVEGTITYVQPIFIQADDSAITELVGVVTVNGERVVMGPTLSASLTKLYLEAASSAAEKDILHASGSTETSPSP